MNSLRNTKELLYKNFFNYVLFGGVLLAGKQL